MPGRADRIRWLTITKPYGNVAYADPKNGKYPVRHRRARRQGRAWSYINQADNAAKYPLNGVTSRR